jgi:hypothetical protein
MKVLLDEENCRMTDGDEGGYPWELVSLTLLLAMCIPVFATFARTKVIKIDFEVVKSNRIGESVGCPRRGSEQFILFC